jgi:hypothetical protein
MLQTLLNAIKQLTVEQWRLIDNQFEREKELDLKVFWTCLAVALALVVNQYYCKSNFIMGFPQVRAFFAAQPYPDFYPKLYWAFSKSVSFLLIPLLIIWIVFKEQAHTFGLHFEKSP